MAMEGILEQIEEDVRRMHLSDASFKEKMGWQKEILGYVDLTTGKKEDLRKLLITSVVPLRGKKTKDIWAYVVETQSLGTGKTARLTIDKRVFEQEPLKELDVVYASKLYKNNKGYWYLEEYQIVEEESK